MLRDITEKLLQKENLSFDQAQAALNSILDGECREISVAGFLTALAAKGETADEVGGMAQALRDHAVPVRPRSQALVDIVGTGGDGQHTFNISTTAAFVTAGAGVPVAKHGNRAITSQCGSADLLAALGIKIDAEPAIIARCIDEAHIGFMFAPCHHPAMKYVQPIRKTLGFRTVFNVLGPLANPARVPLQITGVARPYLLDIMAEALRLLGVQRAFVVHGDGMDEFSLSGPTDIAEIHQGRITRHTLDYSDYGLQKCDISELSGGSLEDNVNITRSILEGRETGPRRDVVLFTAAAAIMIADKAPGLADALQAARESITSGRAAKALEKMIEISNMPSENS